MELIRWGRIPYAEAHALMRERMQARVAGAVDDALILCEHDPVYTLGRRRGAEANVLDPREVPVVQVERGGDVTFHGPGQVVGYPVVRLPEGRQDLHAWLRGLEEVLMTALGTWGLPAGRDPRNTGVWVGGRKVAAIGVAFRQWVSWHGFALNVTTDLSYFRRVHPCGLDPDLSTRMSDLLDPCPSWDEVADRCAESFLAWWQGWTGLGAEPWR